MQDVINGLYPELLSDFRDKAAEILKLHTAKHEELAKELAEMLRRDWSGVQIYIPKGTAFELSARDWQIFKDFNGKNLHEMCQKYNLTAARIYQIDAACRKIKDKKEQPVLFGGEEP